MEETKSFDWKSVLYFNTMLMPKIITVLYWVMLLGVALASLGLIFSGSPMAGIGSLIGGAIGVRLWCELMIVLFKINENIQKIADRQS